MASIRRNGINYSSGGGIGGSGDTIIVDGGISPIDTTNLIARVAAKGSYIATEDCWALVSSYSSLENGPGGATIDGVMVVRHGSQNSAGSAVYTMLPLAKGQTLQLFGDMGLANIYGVKESDTTHILNPNEDTCVLLGHCTATNVTFKLSDSLANYTHIGLEPVYSGGKDSCGMYTYPIEVFKNAGLVRLGLYTVSTAFDGNNKVHIRYIDDNTVEVVCVNADSNIKIYGIKDNGGVTIRKKDVYSTEEQEIGTWIDGKSIYRKTITGTLVSVSNSLKTLPIDKVINAYGLTETSYNHTMFIPSGTVDNSATGSGAYGCQLLKHTNGSEWFLQYGTSNNPNGSTVLTVEYTKTIN